MWIIHSDWYTHERIRNKDWDNQHSHLQSPTLETAIPPNSVHTCAQPMIMLSSPMAEPLNPMWHLIHVFLCYDSSLPVLQNYDTLLWRLLDVMKLVISPSSLFFILLLNDLVSNNILTYWVWIYPSHRYLAVNPVNHHSCRISRNPQANLSGQWLNIQALDQERSVEIIVYHFMTWR